MLLCAYIWILLGIGAWLEKTTYIPGAFHLLLSGQVRAVLWVIPALIAIVFAWSREKSVFGLVPLVVMPSISMASYLWAWILTLPIMNAVTEHSVGSDYGWYFSSFYFAFLSMVGLVAVIPPPIPDETKSAISRSKGV
jgi:hypothetical protein